MNKAEKIILPVLKHFVLLQRSNMRNGMKTVGKSVGFFYTSLLSVKPSACWCASAVMPARISFVVLNNTCKPFLLNVLKIRNNEHTASKDGGKDRNQRVPQRHFHRAQVGSQRHYSKHSMRPHLLSGRGLEPAYLVRNGGRLRDDTVADAILGCKYGQERSRRCD